MKKASSRSGSPGQSLIEVLIAVAVGAVMIAAAAALIQPALRENTDVGQVQTMASLGDGLLNNVQSWAAGNWNAVLSLSTTSAHLYYLNTSSTPFSAIATSSGEPVVVGGSTYLRSFYLDSLYRDGSGNVTTTASGNAYDPSTMRVTVVVVASSTTQSTTFVAYLTRSVVNVFSQADWTGGGGQSSPQTLASSTYVTSSNVYASTSGEIYIIPYPPTTPGTPSYTNTASSTLTISWTAATSTTYYGVERGTNGVNFTQIVTTTAIVYNDTGLAASTTYYYRVRGWNVTGWGPYSASSSVTTTN